MSMPRLKMKRSRTQKEGQRLMRIAVDQEIARGGKEVDPTPVRVPSGEHLNEPTIFSLADMSRLRWMFRQRCEPPFDPDEVMKVAVGQFPNHNRATLLRMCQSFLSGIRYMWDRNITLLSEPDMEPAAVPLARKALSEMSQVSYLSTRDFLATMQDLDKVDWETSPSTPSDQEDKNGK